MATPPLDMDGKPYAVGQTVLVASRIREGSWTLTRRTVTGFSSGGFPSIDGRRSTLLKYPERHYIERQPTDEP